MATLYERIGGEAAVDAAVERFYDKVLADPRLAYLFEGADMQKQRRHQKRFLTYAFGGTPNYQGRSMRVAHERLVAERGLSDAHFDAVLENLGAALVELDVPADLIAEAAAVAESTRPHVLGRTVMQPEAAL